MTAAEWISKRTYPGKRLVTQRRGDRDRTRPYFVVCGDDQLAHRLVEELVSRYNAHVTVVLRSRRRNHGPQLAALPGVRIIEAGQLDADVFRAAKLPRAGGLALVQQDDVGNIHAALRAQELRPTLRLVIRMFNMSLGHGVRQLFPDCAVLSDAAMAAPEFVAAALGEVAPAYVRLAGRTIYAARRADVHPHDVLCGIAATTGSDPPEVLPVDDQDTDIVLVVANRHRLPLPLSPDGDVPASRRLRRRARRRRRSRRAILSLSRALLSLVDSKLEIALLVLIIVLVGGVVTIGLVDNLTPWQALYTTLLIAADAGDPDLDVHLVRQLSQAAVAVAGIAMVPVLTAVVVNAAVNARFAAALGRLRQPMTGHIVVIGLGNVGTRVIRHLHDLGYDMVAVDQADTARGAQVARELGIPLVIGDASREETLRQASVGTCRALLALSSSDVVNLEAALHARNLRRGMQVVLRLFDGDFARRVEKAFDIPISRSVSSLAAPAFAAALLEREVIGTIAVRRRVLLIAEVPVAAGSRLAGQCVADVSAGGRVRVLALAGAKRTAPVWDPSPSTPVEVGNRLMVIATRAGLSQILASSTPEVTDDHEETP